MMNRKLAIEAVLLLVPLAAGLAWAQNQTPPNEGPSNSTLASSVTAPTPPAPSVTATAQVSLKTGLQIHPKHGTPTDMLATATLETYDGAPAIAFPMTYEARDPLTFGQVGPCASGTFHVTSEAVTYIADTSFGAECPAGLLFTLSRNTTNLVKEGGREGDSFSLYVSKKRYRFAGAKFDSDFLILFRQAISDFPGAYARVQRGQ